MRKTPVITPAEVPVNQTVLHGPAGLHNVSWGTLYTDGNIYSYRPDQLAELLSLGFSEQPAQAENQPNEAALDNIPDGGPPEAGLGQTDPPTKPGRTK